jgi:hypothetical protein
LFLIFKGPAAISTPSVPAAGHKTIAAYQSFFVEVSADKPTAADSKVDFEH